jgi:hypothetical protein
VVEENGRKIRDTVGTLARIGLKNSVRYLVNIIPVVPSRRQYNPVLGGESERARGILLGLLMGDRNGGPIQMALELASSPWSLGRFSPEDVRRRCLEWFLRQGTDTGPVSARVFELISVGATPADAVAQVHHQFGGLTAG